MRRRSLTKEEPSKERGKKHPLISYECKKSDHFKKVPKKFKKKAVAATWSDTDDSSSDEDTHKKNQLVPYGT